MRRSYIRRRSPRRIFKQTPEEKAYLDGVRGLPCMARVLGDCHGDIHAHHAGRSGVGQKAPDDTAIPLCWFHHGDWHNCNGVFSGWKREKRREWALLAIGLTRAKLAWHPVKEIA
jgi:hypothetical protein